MRRSRKPSSAHAHTPTHTVIDDNATINSVSPPASAAAAASAAPAPATPASAAPAPATAAAALAPAPRRSSRSRTAGSAGSKRSSAAAAASSPTVAATASKSIDENDEQLDSAAAAASAPANKRARTSKTNAGADAAASSAASSSASTVVQSSPMIRLLGRDTGAQFVLCELLSLNEIGRLHRTCRSWRRWIGESMLGSSHALHYDRRVPLSLKKSSWAPRHVQRLALGISPTFKSPQSEHKYETAHSKPAAGYEKGRPDEIAGYLLPRFNRLRALQLVLRHETKRVALPRILPLTSISVTSLALTVRYHNYWVPPPDPFTAAFMRSLGGFPSLTSLTLESDHELNDVDFASLPSLAHLQRLSMPTKHVVFSPAQVAALVSCRALTDLDAGKWLPGFYDYADDEAAEEDVDDWDEDDVNADESDNDGAEEEDVDVDDMNAGESDPPPSLDAGLVPLIQGRKRNGAAPLRNIRLGFSDYKGCITPAVAAHLLAMHELESLERVVWSSSLTAEHWAQLSLFTRFTSAPCPRTSATTITRACSWMLRCWRCSIVRCCRRSVWQE